MRRCCSGHSYLCSCSSTVRFLDSESLSKRRLLLRPAPRRVHFARAWTRASKPTLRLSSGREETCRGASRGTFFSTKHPSPARELLLCVYSRMTRIATKDARWALCSPCSLGSSPRRPTASCSLAAVRRGDCVRASRLNS